MPCLQKEAGWPFSTHIDGIYIPFSSSIHIFSPLAVYFSDTTFNRMAPKLREGFLDAAKQAATDTRAHGLAVEKEALAALVEKGVTVVECDKEAFRKRVLPQTDNFIKARPEAKAVVELIRATQA